MNTIAKPFGLLLMWLYELTSNYGVAIILFAIVVKLILLPFQMKSKRGSMRMALLQPQMQDLEKRYGSNKQKYSEEVQKLYQSEGVNPMSGCLWSLIPFPIVIALYYAVRQPLTTMMGISKDLLSEGGAILEKLTALGYEGVASRQSAYEQIFQSKFISEHFSEFAGITDKLHKIDFSFLGVDLGSVPNWKIWTFNWSDAKELLPALGLFLVPVLAAVFTYLSSYVTMKMNPQQNGDMQQAQSMATMTLMMPLMTLWFAFLMPAALGVYWAINSVLMIIQDIILTKYYGKILAAETAERDARRIQREAEYEAKRQETERLRAMNATTENANTSKRKQQNKQKKAQEKKAAEWEKARADSAEDEPSRVDDRKYARGRAYDPDRFTRAASDDNEENVEEAEETDLIAPEAYDETVEESYDEESYDDLPDDGSIEDDETELDENDDTDD